MKNPQKNLTSFLFSKPVPFSGYNFEKQKGPGTSYQSLFRFPNLLKSLPLVIHHKGNFCAFIRIGF